VLYALWSAKGGAGVTTAAVGLADALRRRSGGGVLLVDLAGDMPATVGLADPEVGLTDWLASDAGPEALTRIEQSAAEAVGLLGLGAATEWARTREVELAAVLAADRRDVLVDLGRIDDGTRLASMQEELLGAASRSLLVTRACYLALRRAVRAGREPDGVVLVREPGRALDRGDVEGLLSVQVVAEIDLDPGVARAVDAGFLLAAAPRHLARALRRAA
jgi:hypothetical protein